MTKRFLLVPANIGAGKISFSPSRKLGSFREGRFCAPHASARHWLPGNVI